MAAGPSRTLTLRYLGDAKNLSKANQEAEGGLAKLGKSFGTFAKVAAVGAAAAGTALLAFAKKSVDAAIEAEAAQTRLETILRNTGLASEEQIKALGAQAIALEKVGVASAGNITVLQSQLATFDLTADTIKTLTPAIVDYVIAEKGATATAGDFQSATNGLAQALQGNFASLTATGFVLDDTTKELIANGTEAERAAALVEVLNSTYEGFNEVARETSEGQMVALQNAFGSLKEQIGTALLPAFNNLTEGALGLVEKMQALWEVHGPGIIEAFNNAKDRVLELWSQIREKLEPIIRDLIARFIDLIGQFREWWERVSPGVINSFKRLKDPIVELWDNIKIAWEQIRELIGAFRSGESDGQGFQRFIDGLVGFIGLLIQGINLALEGLERFLSFVQRIVESRAFQALVSGLGSVANFVGRKTQEIAGLAEGGIVTKPTLAMIGEGGEPEAVIPLSKMGQMGGGVNITINGALDPEGVARQIRRLLEDSGRRTGATLQFA